MNTKKFFKCGLIAGFAATVTMTGVLVFANPASTEKNLNVAVSTSQPIIVVEAPTLEPTTTPIPTPTPEPIEGTMYTTGNLNVRKEPSMKGAVLITVKPNTELHRIANDGTWSTVVIDGVNYYVATEYLTFTKPAEVASSAAEQIEAKKRADAAAAEKKRQQQKAAVKKTQTQSSTSGSTTAPNVGDSGRSLGKFKLTAYCNCSSCCGKWSGGPTASGKYPSAGRTIAVDPNVIPLGTMVKINGRTYVAEDTGGSIKGNRIDVYFDSHSAALNFGVQYAEVYIVK